MSTHSERMFTWVIVSYKRTEQWRSRKHSTCVQELEKATQVFRVAGQRERTPRNLDRQHLQHRYASVSTSDNALGDTFFISILVPPPVRFQPVLKLKDKGKTNPVPQNLSSNPVKSMQELSFLFPPPRLISHLECDENEKKVSPYRPPYCGFFEWRGAKLWRPPECLL